MSHERATVSASRAEMYRSLEAMSDRAQIQRLTSGLSPDP